MNTLITRKPTLLHPETPALILAPMDGITDAAMRAVQGETGAFTYAVSEFQRVSSESIPRKVFHRHVPELLTDSLTPTGLPVQVQILGGDPARMAKSAWVACRAGAIGIDINFGCPAPTVNRSDGGATLLKYPQRIREVVSAVRAAVPCEIPVSAKLRLGWDSIDAIHENADMATEGGASWLTIHARTKMQGYAPPVFWKPIGQVRGRVGIPVVANGDIWNREDFLRCLEETGCRHFMLGRGALANPLLPYQVAQELGIGGHIAIPDPNAPFHWLPLLERFIHFSHYYGEHSPVGCVMRLKQWMNLAHKFGNFVGFDSLKLTKTPDEFFECLRSLEEAV